MSLTDNTPEAALAFLQRYAPAGPWVLTAIAVDKNKIETRTFRPGADGEIYLTSWLNKKADCNIYFHVNSTMGDLSKKAGRKNIKSVDWLHVDIDPRAGEDLQEERERALGLLTENLPEGVPDPTVIIFSGGGYQAFWKLEDPIEINGDLALAEDAKRFNVELETRFGADNCHNIDRIMRLPGTVNWPDAGKIKKGREPALATLHSFNDDKVYPLGEFKQAPVLASDGSFIPVDMTDAAAISDLDELDTYNVDDYLKMLIRDGVDPDKPKKGDDSRSGWLLHVVCALRRHGVPDSVTLGIILNRAWRISESVVSRSDSLAYAQKQIKAAQERAQNGDELLLELNKKHAVLLQEGGKTRVLAWDQSELDDRHQIPILQTFADLRNRYLNQDVVIGLSVKGLPKTMKLGHWWLQHHARKEYTGLRFAPDKPREFDGYLNLWQGFAVEAKPGDWSLFGDNILRLVGGNAEYAYYVMTWLAWTFQNPAEQAEVSITFRGRRGTGKGIFGRGIVSIFGQHGLHIYSPHHLTGQFNVHMRDRVLLFADEAYVAGDKKAESVIKAIHTEPTLQVEPKGIDTKTVPNRLHIITASNEDWVVPAGIDERRFAIFDVAQEIPGPEYFAALCAEIDAGGLGAMLFDLLALDLEGWHPREDVPQTAVLEEQKRHGDSDALQWVFGILESGIIGTKTPGNNFAPPRTYLVGPLMQLIRQQIPGLQFKGDPTLTQILKDWGWKSWKSGSHRGWTAPSLLAMRQQWNAQVRPTTWDDDLIEFDQEALAEDADAQEEEYAF